MKQIILSVLFFGVLNIGVFAQLSPPVVEAVYGGRINSITGYSKTSDTSRIYISTESANSIFYTDVYAPTTGSPVFSPFYKLNAVDANDNFGSNIRSIAVHNISGYLLFGWDDGIYKVNPSSSTATRIINVQFPDFFIHGSSIVIYSGGKIYWGLLDINANYFSDASSPLTLSIPASQYFIEYNAINSRIYLFSFGTSPALYKSSNDISSLSSATTFSSISLTSLGTADNWTAMGVSPSGRLFLGGSNGPSKLVAYSDDESTWNIVNTGVEGVSSENIAFGGNSTNYYVYFASGYSTNRGESGSWLSFGNPGGLETNPNDGAVFCDPNNSNIVYMTTDQGIGASIDRGATIFEIDDGVEAVQVDDFDMTADKQTAWLASKSGIRRVDNYQTIPEWTRAIFPNGDGSPYYSAEMIPNNPNSVYVGNVRVYKSTNSGSTWQQVFTAESAPYNFDNVQSKIQAIEVCDYDTNIVMAGYLIEGTDKGGLFYSYDNGVSWSQINLHSSTVGQDVDVYDIVFNLEGSDTVAYIGVEYDLSSPTGRSVYKLTKNGAAWSVSQDMNGTATSTGTSIVATIRDLFVSVSQDTIYACGTDAGINHPIVYYKPLNTSGKWTPFTTTGFPFVAGKQAYALTKGVDTLYVAVDNQIYLYDFGSGVWIEGTTYPVGMRINFLYYDELLAGTSTGLYAHYGLNPSGVDADAKIPQSFYLEQNFPNPFNPSTKISFSLLKDDYIELVVYDLLGKEVASLVDGYMKSGKYSVIFNGTNLSTGIYFCTLKGTKLNKTIKMMLIK